MQIENNRVRPFTYTHFNDDGNYIVANYTHANIALAHPMGAGFQESILLLKYQPLKKVYLTAKAIYYKQGLDTGKSNLGTNVFLTYQTRSRGEYGYFIGTGNEVKSLNLSLLTSYEVYENLYIDADFQYRTYNRAIQGNSNTSVFSIGVRWNMARRVFDF